MAERPFHEIRLGRVKATIWRNEGEHGPRYNVTFSRVFKTDSGWDSSSSFGRDELPLVEKIADLAHHWIFQMADRDGPCAEEGDTERPQASRRAAAT
jgi:hypothetical protein